VCEEDVEMKADRTAAVCDWPRAGANQRFSASSSISASVSVSVSVVYCLS
jgi:hypothetical protein